MKICVFLTSATEIDESYQHAAAELGKQMAERGHEAIFGGTEYGLMKAFADSYKASGGKQLIGVLAEDLITVTKNYKIHPLLDQQILTPSMGERKNTLLAEADAFIALPGGYATFEELCTVIGARINKLFNKPVAVANINGYYNDFLAQMEKVHELKFSKIPSGDAIFSSEVLSEILSYFENYKHREMPDKFVSNNNPFVKKA